VDYGELREKLPLVDDGHVGDSYGEESGDNLAVDSRSSETCGVRDADVADAGDGVGGLLGAERLAERRVAFLGVQAHSSLPPAGILFSPGHLIFVVCDSGSGHGPSLNLGIQNEAGRQRIITV